MGQSPWSGQDLNLGLPKITVDLLLRCLLHLPISPRTSMDYEWCILAKLRICKIMVQSTSMEFLLLVFLEIQEGCSCGGLEQSKGILTAIQKFLWPFAKKPMHPTSHLEIHWVPSFLGLENFSPWACDIPFLRSSAHCQHHIPQRE